MARVTSDFVEAVWSVFLERTSDEYPQIQFSKLVERVAEKHPNATADAVQAALQELEEQLRVDCNEGFAPESEIYRMRTADFVDH